MSGRSFSRTSRVVSVPWFGLVLVLLLAACGRSHDGNPPALQGSPAPASSATHPAGTSGLALVSASSTSSDSRTALTLRFNAPLASAQTFDDLIAVTGPKGEVVSGSWSLQENGKTLGFPFVQANTRYVVELKASLLAADGRTLGHAMKREVYSGNLPAAVGFASHGSVLPARGTRGLPLVSMNLHDADVEFFRVHDDALSDLFCAYPRNGHRNSYELDHVVNYYNDCLEGGQRRSKLPITRIADSVYANHYSLGDEPNERTVTYLPV